MEPVTPGLASGGETSPPYVLYVAALYRLLGAQGVPYALQTLGVLAWGALLAGVWRLVRILGADPGWALAVVASVGLMPGSARNAVMGMENVYFAAGLVWVVVSMALSGWFATLLPFPRELAFGSWAARLRVCGRRERSWWVRS